MKTITAIIALAIVSQVYSDAYKTFKCPDDKAKMKGICALVHEDNEGNKHFNIFDKCKNGKKCEEFVDNVYTCKSEVKQRKLGQSCTYNEDCYTGNCDDEECKAVSGQCTKDSQCGAGQICAYANKEDSTAYKKTCIAGTKDGTYTGYGGCAPGYFTNKISYAEDYDASKTTYTCKGMATLDDGEETLDSEICKSGLAYNGKCDSIVSVGTCTETTSKVDIEWSKGGKVANGVNCYSTYKFITGDKIYYNQYTGYEAQKALRDAFLDALEKFDFDDILTDEKRAHMDLPFKYKYLKKYYLAKYANTLFIHGLIDEEGEVDDDYECEYNFYVKFIAASHLKLGLLFTFVVALLGF